MAKNCGPFSEHKGGVGPFLKIPRSNSESYHMFILKFFSCFSLKSYVVIPHLNHLNKTVKMRGHNICVETVQMRGHNIYLCKIDRNYPL